ncbi:hypothetical protein TEQG_02350 [Trichophyton equinum CBS 127.97]|uniref:Uncharacterized protein n=1 Tax=Trichophyton equinum (strain ATCC MYA-4606 / CBS 127.97) TaxID=559882 RepID=F2PN47_TRIEC|nr:hypothetical protein TEQG_02350 [Trichophyton equinum CBS 127.97]
MRDQILGGPEPTKAFNSQMSLDGGKQSQVDTTLHLEIFPYIIDIMSSARDEPVCRANRISQGPGKAHSDYRMGGGDYLAKPKAFHASSDDITAGVVYAPSCAQDSPYSGLRTLGESHDGYDLEIPEKHHLMSGDDGCSDHPR